MTDDEVAGDYWRPTLTLMLEEARRSVDRQGEILHRTRERVSSLVGFASIVAAALGFAAEKPGGILGFVGLGAYVVVIVSAIYVLMPRTFQHDLSARRMYAWLDDPDNEGNNHSLITTALAHQDHYDANHSLLSCLQIAIMVNVVALGVEVVALTARIVL